MSSFTQPLTKKIAGFLREIGLGVEFRDLPEGSFLPGLALVEGRIVIDELKLLYPGDILHEAGHLALTSAADRCRCDGKLAASGGEEMGAIAWSYAAALHLGIDPEIVFHSHGYRDGSSSLLENFREGRYIGVPMLQWLGLSLEPRQARERGCPPYPHMIRWLRE